MRSSNLLLVTFVNFFVSLLFLVGWTSADLTLTGTKCGAKICQQHQYCSDFDRLCKSCFEICTEKHHNYDSVLCTRDCQDYLHDLKYVRKDANSTAIGGNDLNDVVQKLHYMVSVSLTLTCLVLIILLIILCVQVYKWKKRNNVTWATLKNKLLFKKTGSNSVNNSNSNSNRNANNKGVAVSVTSQSGKPDLRLEMPQSPASNSDFSPSTMTTSISRRPVEDCNLDYAYDNPAMSSSNSTPSPNKPYPIRTH